MADIVQLEEKGTVLYPKTHVKSIEGLIDFIYPVGSIYMSTENLDLNTRLGGIWERIKGKVLVGVDENDEDFAVGKTGGEKATTLTNTHIPTNLQFSVGNKTAIGSDRSDVFVKGTTNGAYAAGGDGVGPIKISNAGGKSHNNLQPYMTIFIWKRVS